MIPNKAHFIFGLAADFGGKPFCFMHYLAMRSFAHHHPDFEINLYFAHEPASPYWAAAKALAQCRKISPPSEIFGRPLRHVAHQADVIRLAVLLAEGGIYLDFDTITVRSFAPLLDRQCVIGQEALNGKIEGLCNAIILAEANSRFLALWQESYKTFRSQGRDEFWNEHSVRIPSELAGLFPESVTVLGNASLMRPEYSEGEIEAFFFGDFNHLDHAAAFAHHLWESVTWGVFSRINETSPAWLGPYLSQIIRTVVPAADLERFADYRKQRLERLMRSPIRLNLGSGANPIDGCVNVDMHPESMPDLCFDISRAPWPIADNQVVETTAFHVLEHVGAGFRELIQQLYRVSRDGALVHIKVPHPRHDDFLTDPTHCRPFLPESFTMLDRSLCARRMIAGDSKTPLAIYWGVDFVVTDVKLNLDRRFPLRPAPGANTPALETALQHWNNVAAELAVTLRVRKAPSPAQAVFASIYRRAAWGSGDTPYYSGPGSDDELSGPYVDYVVQRLRERQCQRVLDLGCGDFRVGARIAAQLPALSFIAIDVVPGLIALNQEKFRHLANVEFRCLDIAAAPLPDADAVLIRQLLQHCDNDTTARILAAVRKFPLALVTEHVKLDPQLPANLDQITGAGIRPGRGLILELPPFSLRVRTVVNTPLGADEALITSEILEAG